MKRNRRVSEIAMGFPLVKLAGLVFLMFGIAEIVSGSVAFGFVEAIIGGLVYAYTDAMQQKEKGVKK